MPASRLRPLLAAALVAAAGCGDGRPPTYPVRGKLTYADGTPVPGASVTFLLASDPLVAARGRAADDGTFTLTTFAPGDGAVAGEHMVAVASIPGGDGERRPPPAVPEKYSDAATGGLRATVNAEPTDVTLTIDRPGPKR